MDSVFRFRSAAKASQSIFKEKGSKFLGFLYPVESLTEVQEKLADLRKAYHDASHHCYAWVIGPDKHAFRANDDGEPKHSAGDPILGQIRSKDLTNVLIVVVRYFGGTKLGVGGLATAYRQAAALAIAETEIVEQHVTEILKLRYTYSDTAAIMRFVSGHDIQIVDQLFGERCEATLRVRKEDEVKLIEALDLLRHTAGSLEIKMKKEAPGNNPGPVNFD